MGIASRPGCSPDCCCSRIGGSDAPPPVNVKALAPVGGAGRPTARMVQPRKPVDSQGIAAMTASASKSAAM